MRQENEASAADVQHDVEDVTDAEQAGANVQPPEPSDAQEYSYRDVPEGFGKFLLYWLVVTYIILVT